MQAVLAIIDTPQHLVPGGRTGLAQMIRELLAGNHSRVEYNFTEAVQVYGLTNQTQQGTVHSILGFLLAAVLVVAGFILLYWLSMKGKSSTVYVRGRGLGATAVSDLEQFYIYSGTKRELRRLYKTLLYKLQRLGVYVPRGYTVTEVASRAKTVLGHSIELFALIYNRYMYSPAEPPQEIVEEARSLVESESR